RRAVRQDPAAILFDPNRHRFVALRIQILEHRRGRGERDFMFAGATAVDDANAQLFHGKESPRDTIVNCSPDDDTLRISRDAPRWLRTLRHDDDCAWRSRDAGVHAGSAPLLTPEKATDIQAQLGADIAMALDECLAHPADSTSARRSMERTLGWARRARDRFLTIRDGRACSVIVTNPAQAQFGIIQGSVFPELREESVRATV